MTDDTEDLESLLQDAVKLILIEPGNARETGFWAAVDADPRAIVLVVELDPDGDRTTVWSTLERATAFVYASDCPCVVSALVLDEPSFGRAELN